MKRSVVGTLFVLSGAAGLLYQVVWSRSLTLLFGSTTLAVSTVITAFMAGLAAGSFLFGRVADRGRKALLLYAALEVGIAATALLFPFFLEAMKPVQLFLHRNLHGSYLLFPASRFLLCFAGLIVPTALMGGTLPVITRFFVKERETLGGDVGALYSLNTFGAMAGCAAAGFFLIPALGTQGVVWLAVGLNLLAALGALVVSRSEKEREAQVGEPAVIERAPAENALDPRAVLVLFGAAGFASLAYEVLWTRALLFFLGWFAVYAFTIILSTFLFGIALGSALFPVVFRGGRRLVAGFAVIEIAIGVFGMISVPVFGRLFEVIRSLERGFIDDNWWRFIFARAGGSFAVMLLPTLLMGLAFPVAAALYSRAGRGYGQTVGNVYASNTVGAILGSLLAGFLLLPVLGVSRSIAVISLVNLAVGGFVILLSSRRGARRLAGAFALLSLLVLGGANLFLSQWRPMILESRHFKNPDRPMELLYADEGATASLAVLRDKKAGHLELNINGESTAYTTYTDMQVHLMLSHTPLLLAEEPEKVLVIGFGMGVTCYGAVLYPSVERVDCVELVPKEVETAAFFRSVNRGILDHPKFRLIIDDGRTFIFAAEEKYDLISFNAIHPSHSPALYTSDFYAECRARMTEKGLICAWVPTNSFTERQFQILLRTFLSVFPHSSLWYVNPNHLVLIGALEPLRIDYDDFVRKASLPGVREDLARYTMEDPLRLLAFHLMDEHALERYTRSVPVNSDDKPYLEYSRELYTRPEIIDAMLFNRTSILPYLTIAEKFESTAEELERYEKAAFHLLGSQAISWIEASAPDPASTSWRADAEIREAFRSLPGDANLRVIAGITERDESIYRSRIAANPFDDEAWDPLFRLYRLRGDWERAADLLEEIRGTPTDEAHLTQALLRLRKGEPAIAEQDFLRLAKSSSPFRRDLGARFAEIARLEARRRAGALGMEELLALADRLWTVGEREAGEEIFREALILHPDRPLPLVAFAHALERSMRIDEAEPFYAAALAFPVKRDEFREAVERGLERTRTMLALRAHPNEESAIEGPDGSRIPVDPWSAGTRVRLGEILLAEGFGDRASVEFRIAAALDPSNPSAREGLGRALARRGLVREAAEELRLAIRLDPSRTAAREELERVRRR
ncbi:MAG: fused MFS/spermidine synthase [Candidatus Eisenbacteria bacterium]|nr:fused MFS/spermidine synthase [Candidatus Eisenbacteria bacterium]